MPGRPADQAAQHIPPPLVGGQDAVADHESSGTDMIRDQADGHILFVVRLVLHAGDAADPVPNGFHCVDVEHGVHILHYHRQTL